MSSPLISGSNWNTSNTASPSLTGLLGIVTVFINRPHEAVLLLLLLSSSLSVYIRFFWSWCPGKVTDDEQLHFSTAAFLLQDICCRSSFLVQPSTIFCTLSGFHSSLSFCLSLFPFNYQQSSFLFVTSPLCPPLPLILFS